MKRYKRLFERKKITEMVFWNIIKKYKDLKVTFDDNFCYITAKPLGSRGEVISMNKQDTMLGQNIKQVQAEIKQLFYTLNNYDFEDIAIQGPQNNQIFLVDDMFLTFENKK